MMDDLQGTALSVYTLFRFLPQLRVDRRWARDWPLIGHFVHVLGNV